MATIITAARQPVRLNDLIAEYETLGPALRRGGPEDGWWTNFRRELGTLVEVHPAHRPAANPDARYQRAKQHLATGDVDQALAETMRLPGAGNAPDWIAKARRYIAAHRALDEIESAALLVAAPRSTIRPRLTLERGLASDLHNASLGRRAQAEFSRASLNACQMSESPGER